MKATGLTARLVQPISTLSKGYRQRVALAQAILHKPSVLVLDEPTNGLDPVQILEIRALIRRLAETTTVIISTHILSEIEAVCNRVVILIDGNLAADSDLEALLSSNVVRLVVDAADEQVVQTLSALENVEEVLDNASERGRTVYRVRCTPGTEMAAEISGAAHAAGWIISGSTYRNPKPGAGFPRPHGRACQPCSRRGDCRMNGSILTIVRKELRSYFLSPVALIFLGVFLVATLFIFFTLAKFFARNLADVRPLFNWLPILLVFLVSAITMRQWSEEQKLGTLEVLLTLPLKTSHLVIGKFLAGVILVMLALALTVPLPITVSTLGDLDWGPVIGGYVGALLLASTYMAIGLCVSSRTDNQIVALMVTLVIGGLLYLIGSEPVAEFFGNRTGEFLRSIGTGSRFESIERGVLDIRDFVYYGSLTVFFLTLNVYFLELKRMEAQPADTESRRPTLLTTVLLAGLNVAACNVWLGPVTHARADLTADQEYTISETTMEILWFSNEPLTITGYFEAIHPLLAPLVPRIRDFLREYEVQGKGIVNLSFVNPSTDEEIEEEINERFGISSVPFRVSGRNEQAVVNSYFHILIEYGDEYNRLSFSDLIEFHADDTDMTVRLRNLEYDVSRAIRGVSQGFQSLESVLATTDANIKITGYIKRGFLPQELKAVPARIERAAEEVRTKSGGRVTYLTVDPSMDAKLQEAINQKYGFRPSASDLYSNSRFWCYLLVESGKTYPVLSRQLI